MSTALSVQSWAPHVLLERGEQLLLFTRKRGNTASTGSTGCPQQIQLNQRKGKAAMSRGLPSGTPLALYHQPRELRTHPSTKSLQTGDLVSSFGMPRSKFAIIPILFSSFLFSQSCWGPGVASCHFSQRLCLAFLAGIFGSTSAWWGAEGLKHKVSGHLEVWL